MQVFPISWVDYSYARTEPEISQVLLSLCGGNKCDIIYFIKFGIAEEKEMDFKKIIFVYYITIIRIL
jgi:hypothetical protein